LTEWLDSYIAHKYSQNFYTAAPNVQMPKFTQESLADAKVSARDSSARMKAPSKEIDTKTQSVNYAENAKFCSGCETPRVTV